MEGIIIASTLKNDNKRHEVASWMVESDRKRWYYIIYALSNVIVDWILGSHYHNQQIIILCVGYNINYRLICTLQISLPNHFILQVQLHITLCDSASCAFSWRLDWIYVSSWLLIIIAWCSVEKFISMDCRSTCVFILCSSNKTFYLNVSFARKKKKKQKKEEFME